MVFAKPPLRPARITPLEMGERTANKRRPLSGEDSKSNTGIKTRDMDNLSLLVAGADFG